MPFLSLPPSLRQACRLCYHYQTTIHRLDTTGRQQAEKDSLQ